MKISAMLVVVLVAALFFWSTCAYTVGEAEQVIITEFGKPVSGLISDAGLHWKKPFIQDVRRFERRVLHWHGEPREIPTREKKFIFIDTMARWRIADPLTFLQSVGSLNAAKQRLDNILDGVMKDTVSSHALIDIVRTSNRQMLLDVDTIDEEKPENVTLGRNDLMGHVTREAALRLRPLGLELLDVRITRVNFVEKVLTDVYRRMVSERQRIAERFRSEGQGERARILGELERDQKKILSEAFRDAEKTRGDADAIAARTYAEAYTKNADFYVFVKSLETLDGALDGGETTAVLSTSGELMQLLRGVPPLKK